MRIFTVVLVVLFLGAGALPATAQQRPRPEPLPETCASEVTTAGVSPCSAWLSGASVVDVPDAIVKALAGFAVDKGAGFVLGKIGLASLVDPASGKLDALKAQLDQIAQQITVLQASTDNVFTALKQLSLDTKLQYLRDLVINAKTLFGNYYVAMVGAIEPVVAAKRTDPSCATTACQKAQSDFDELRKQFLDQFQGGGGVALAGTNTKIHESLLPSDPGQSVLSAYGDLLMAKNRFHTPAQSSALRQLYTTFADWEALATWMKAEWIAATRAAQLPKLIEDEIVGYGNAETAALPPKIPDGAVIDLGPNASTRTSTRNKPMWFAVGPNLRWIPFDAHAGSNDVAGAVSRLNAVKGGFTDWKPPSRSQMDTLLATASDPNAAAKTTLRAISPADASWTKVVDASAFFWTSDTSRTGEVTCSYHGDPRVPLKERVPFNAGPYRTYTAYNARAPRAFDMRPRIWPLTVPNLRDIGPPEDKQRAPCDSYVLEWFQSEGALLATRRTADSAKEDYMAFYARPKSAPRKTSPPSGPPFASTTTLSSSKNPATFTEVVTFTARVRPSGSGTGDPTGDVRFAVDGVVAGDPVPVQSGVATSPPFPNLSVGSHRVEALYLGGPELAPSSAIMESDQTIEKVPTDVALVADPPNPSYEGDPVVFHVTTTAQPPAGQPAGDAIPTGTVELREGDVKLGEGTLDGGRVSITIPDLKDGNHAIVASYGGDDSFDDAKSAPLEQRVRNLAKISVTPANIGALGQGDTVQLTATGTFSDNTTADLTADVNWSSSDPGVATVSKTGLVTIALDAPKTDVTITAALAQQKDTTSLVVGLPGPPPPEPPAPTTTTPSSAPSSSAPPTTQAAPSSQATNDTSARSAAPARRSQLRSSRRQRVSRCRHQRNDERCQSVKRP
jgi:hypothetical protein